MVSKNTWKVIAIIFIVLFLLETSFFIWGIYLSSQDKKNEQKCIVNICGYNYHTKEWGKGYFSYNYNTKSKICYCYNEKGEITKQIYFGK